MAEGNATNATGGPARRWRWGFWGWAVVTVVGVGMLVLATWAIWLAGATRQKNLALQETRDLGLPTTPAALLADLEAVPDDENVAIDVLAAAAVIDTDGEAIQEWQEWNPPDSMLTERERTEHAMLLADVIAEQAAAIERAADLDAKVPPMVDRARGDFGQWPGFKARLEAGEQPIKRRSQSAIFSIATRWRGYSLRMPGYRLTQVMARVLCGSAFGYWESRTRSTTTATSWPNTGSRPLSVWPSPKRWSASLARTGRL